MTSGATQQETEAFFKQNNYFGLDPANVILFEQNLTPCLTTEGKVCSSSNDDCDENENAVVVLSCLHHHSDSVISHSSADACILVDPGHAL